VVVVLVVLVVVDEREREVPLVERDLCISGSTRSSQVLLSSSSSSSTSTLVSLASFPQLAPGLFVSSSFFRSLFR
jgi:hypothetical protein